MALPSTPVWSLLRQACAHGQNPEDIFGRVHTSTHAQTRTHARTHTHTHTHTDALLVRAYNVPRVITWNDSPVTSVINLSWGRERSVWVVVGFSSFSGGRRLLLARFRGVNSKVRSVNFFIAQAREFRFGSVVLLNVLGCRLTC